MHLSNTKKRLLSSPARSNWQIGHHIITFSNIISITLLGQLKRKCQSVVAEEITSQFVTLNALVALSFFFLVLFVCFCCCYCFLYYFSFLLNFEFFLLNFSFYYFFYSSLFYLFIYYYFFFFEILFNVVSFVDFQIVRTFWFWGGGTTQNCNWIDGNSTISVRL